MDLSFAVLKRKWDIKGVFVITPTDHWKTRGCLYDQWFELPEGVVNFYQLADSYYEYSGATEDKCFSTLG